MGRRRIGGRGREAAGGGRVDRAEGGYAQRPGEGARACFWGWNARRDGEDGSGASGGNRPEEGKAMEHASHRGVVGSESSIFCFFFLFLFSFSVARFSFVWWVESESVEPRRRLSGGLSAPKVFTSY